MEKLPTIFSADYGCIIDLLNELDRRSNRLNAGKKYYILRAQMDTIRYMLEYFDVIEDPEEPLSEGIQIERIKIKDRKLCEGCGVNFFEQNCECVSVNIKEEEKEKVPDFPKNQWVVVKDLGEFV